MNRFDRITAILIQLQSRKIVRAQDLADRFEISLRTVYRDISSLAEAGVPIVSEAGVGYSIMDGYRLPPVMFTREEARTFITAEKLMEKFTDLTVKSHYQSAMYKIRAVLKSSEKSMVENLENHIEVRQHYSPFATTSDNSLDLLLKSISEKKAVNILYTALGYDQASMRLIEPVGVYHENNYWYTVAYCHLRKNYRNFRLDRIVKIELTDTSFNLQHAPLKDFLQKQVSHDQNLHLIIIRLQKRIRPYINEQKYYYGYVSEVIEDDIVEMTFLSSYLEGFARWFMMLAPDASIVQPQILKDRLKKLIAEISEKL
ncbi:hypothetical protein DYBT9275_01857 [Dyadobacter sp. CECT 9275]|uniref:HTH deoR-type domain-containing protein n=1 Tax=Dyadobacter helix TaxID=2822344 RepID=A0A916J9S0_9BACT|nr:YafY family protein [Dyadobacter sp. CECT 9275]CAG4997817.1 hypothetical protein DYBT9275_01857 [Dyadobacter sp. CECT 9275]